MFEQVNTALFYAVNQLPGSEFYDRMMLLGTFLGSRANFFYYLLAFAFIGVSTVQYYRSRTPEKSLAIALLCRNVMIVFIAAYLADAGFLFVMKHFFHHPRPFVALPEGTVRIIGSKLPESEYYLSFPSGHASFAALIAASLWPALRSAGRILACIFVLWVCWSRLALGVHFPVDVATGAISAACIVIAARAGLVAIFAPEKAA